MRILFQCLLVITLMGGGFWTPFASVSAQSSPTVQRVNAPYFSGNIPLSQMAVFWFGQVNNTTNYMDVRVGYNDDVLHIRTAAFDRRLWYDTTPTPAELDDWDTVTIYLDLNPDGDIAPNSDTYKIAAQLNHWQPRDDYQATYQGDGSDWISVTLPVTTGSGWRGNGPNDDVDDRGWVMDFEIPFAGLGLSGPPTQGTAWGMAVVLHDRDNAGGTPAIADQTWPNSMSGQIPNTWGELAFGLPTYIAPSAIPGDTVLVRQGLNGATVTDAQVGGDSTCGETFAPNYFDGWGDHNYAGTDGQSRLNIQNQGDVADWPCYSKTYFTFPLDLVPANKTVISATLTLHLFGGANPSAAQPSLIQVHTINDNWDESTITWNNGPLAMENISSTWVNPTDFPGWPGIPYDWDVSKAVAEAYADGNPLQVAMYEADGAYHSGKYFVPSETGDWNEIARPTLRILWGDPVGTVQQTPSSTIVMPDDPLTYTLTIVGSGQPLTLTNQLPVGVSDPIYYDPELNYSQRLFSWSGNPDHGETLTFTYMVTITAPSRTNLRNQAMLTQTDGLTSTSISTVWVDPVQVYLPVITKNLQ